MSKRPKLIIFIGEGKTEVTFFRSLLINQYGFEPCAKSSDFIEKKNIYVCLAFPSLGATHKGGNDCVLSSDTYQEVHYRIQTTGYIVQHPEKHIFVMTDTDGNTSTKKEKKIKDAIRAGGLAGKSHIFFASTMIETWFLGGIGNGFKSKYSVQEDLLSKFISQRLIEGIPETRKILENVVPELPKNDKGYVGHEFGLYIDKDLCTGRLLGFRKFITTLETLIM